MAFFNGKRARIIKGTRGAYQEKRRFVQAAAKSRSASILGHIRAASNPCGLPQKRLISLVNSQPFSDGTIAFIHNGTLEIPHEVAKYLGPYRKRIRGVNDSEVYFWQFRKFYDAYGNIPEALTACVREIWAIWDKMDKTRRRKKAPYTGLNAIVSDGKSMHALCHYPYRSEGIASLCSPRWPWGQMSLARRDSRIIFSSEPMDQGSWKAFKDREIISAENRGGRLKLSRHFVTMPSRKAAP